MTHRFALPVLGLSFLLMTATTRAADQSGSFGKLTGVTNAEFNHDGSRVVIRTRAPGIGVWDAATGQPLDGDLKAGTAFTMSHLSRDARALLVGFPGGRSRVFDAASAKAISPLLEVAFEEGESERAAFSPDGKFMVIVDAEFVSTFEVASGNRVLKLPAKVSPTAEEADLNATAVFSGDGSRCFFLVGDKVTAYDTATWKPQGKPFKHPTNDGTYYINLTANLDGRWLATFDNPGENGPKGSLQVWDVIAGKPLGKPISAVNGMEGRFLAGGAKLLASPGRGEATVREVPSLKTLITIKKHDDIEGPKVAPSPDGKWLLSWGSDRELRLIETATGKVIDRFSSNAAISQVLPLPDSSGALVSFDNSAFAVQEHYDYYVVRFIFPEMRPAQSLRVNDFVLNTSLSPDGKTLAVIAGKTDQEQLWLYDATSLRPKSPAVP